MTFLIVLLSVIALIWFALWISPVHRVMFTQTLDAATPLPEPERWPAITIIVPARNEAAMLPTTLGSLCEQDYPGLRVIVVDDQSDDQTPAVLQTFAQKYSNLTILRAADRPAGWCGKPWAVMQGVAQADTELLLFTDADIVFHPQAARQAVRLLESGPYDLVSLFPQLIFSCLSEKIGLTGLVTVLALMFPTGITNSPKSKHAVAAGGFILVRRAPYLAIGGHEAVKGQIIEDVNLAKLMKAANARLHTRLTTDLISTRMYEDFNDMWEGLAKNAFAGMEYKGHKFVVGVIVGAVVMVLPPIYLLASLTAALLTYPATPKLWAIVGLSAVINLLMFLIHRRTINHFKLPTHHAFLMSASMGLYQLIAASSYYQYHFKGGNMWKGRRYTAQVLTGEPSPAHPDPGSPIQ